MDGEEFFDRLYSQFYVHFPCYAVVLNDGEGFATEPAADGTESLVLLTDEHLVERYVERAGGQPFPAVVNTPALLGKLLHRLPPSITHVTFDPSPRFHRRYEIGLIRDGLTATATRKAG